MSITKKLTLTSYTLHLTPVKLKHFTLRLVVVRTLYDLQQLYLLTRVFFFLRYVA